MLSEAYKNQKRLAPNSDITNKLKYRIASIASKQGNGGFWKNAKTVGENIDEFISALGENDLQTTMSANSDYTLTTFYR